MPLDFVIGDLHWGVIVSTSIAAFALVMSVVALLLERHGNRRHQADIAAVQTSQAEHLRRIADALASEHEVEQAPAPRGEVDDEPWKAELVGDTMHRRLRVTNTARRRGRLISAEVIGDPQAVLMDRSADYDLYPAESVDFPIAITFGTPHPIRIQLQWLDTLGLHERTRTF
jgi:hypothetical protein